MNLKVLKILIPPVHGADKLLDVSVYPDLLCNTECKSKGVLAEDKNDYVNKDVK